MALDDFLISTGVDQLIRLVKERGKIEIGAAALELKLPNKTVEDWAHVLEEEKLVSIEYKLTKIYLVWHEPTKQYVAQKSEKLQAKASSTKAEIDRLLSKVQDEGKALAAMQQEVSAMGGAQLSAADIKKLKAEISELQEEMAKTAQAASGKLANLQKKALAASEGADSKAAGKKAAAYNELKSEFEVLKRFEETLKSQSDEAESSFSEFEKKIGEMRAQVERGNAEQVLADVKGELESVKSLKDEILGAIEAVTEEVQAMDRKIAELSGRADIVSDSGGSLAAAKKKLAALRKLADEAKKQKIATKERLDDSISLVKKQSARIGDALSRAGAGMGSAESMKNEYVDIAEEMSRANEELAGRQKEISSKLSSQLAALEAGKALSDGKFSKDEIDKISFLLRELRHEQVMLEEKVRMLTKESEILQMEVAPSQKGAPGAGKPSDSAQNSLVERIKISQEDEAAFEQKRDELRSLIRKMWEENKGMGPS